ncbi:MAG: hypothetical protein JWP87_5327 [Labilithrix sp.]|nr:hypothetical protein [Labilithrix sp.]
MVRRTHFQSLLHASCVAGVVGATALLPSCGEAGSAIYLGVQDDPEGTEGSTVATESTAPAPALTDAHVVVVTIDGVRWQDVFAPALRAELEGAQRGPGDLGALMPRTRALVAAQGVALGAGGDGCGIVQTASAANISLPGYLEIFSGHATTCTSNDCDRTTAPTVLDEAVRAGLGPVASISSWPQIDRAVSRGDSGVLVSAGRFEWPAERPAGSAFAALLDAADAADPFPSTGNYRPDRFTAPIALQYFREHSPALFHVGLVDADEWAHRDDLVAYANALREADAVIGQLADAIAESEARDRTTVIVTTDHGRNDDFKDHTSLRYDSSRTFVLAFGARVPARGVICPTRNHTLIDIAPTIRVILGLPAVHGSRRGAPIDEILR